MAVGGTNYSSQQPRDYSPMLADITIPLRTWATGGNTDTVIDANVHPTSYIAITNPTLPAGKSWQVVPSQGSFTITSSDPESAGITYYYRVL